MELQRIVKLLESKFPTKELKGFKEQAVITYDAGIDISRVGYATNLTPEVIEQAKQKGVNLIITHHDAWKFIWDMKEECMKMLESYSISHYFNHLPLDDAPFGTNSSLAKKLGLKELKKVNDESGFMCGLIAEFEEGMMFDDFVELVEETLEEKVMSWQFNDRSIKKVHILCGAGHLTTDMKVAYEEGCDLYLTGEKILYTVEYAKIHKLNLVVGSHTFIELFGVKGMAKIIKEEIDEIEVILINETHLEAEGMKKNT